MICYLGGINMSRLFNIRKALDREMLSHYNSIYLSDKTESVYFEHFYSLNKSNIHTTRFGVSSRLVYLGNMIYFIDKVSA